MVNSFDSMYIVYDVDFLLSYYKFAYRTASGNIYSGKQLPRTYVDWGEKKRPPVDDNSQGVSVWEIAEKCIT